MKENVLMCFMWLNASLPVNFLSLGEKNALITVSVTQMYKVFFSKPYEVVLCV